AVVPVCCPLSVEFAADEPAAGATLYSSPLFETAAPQYAWLNGVQAVAKGRIIEDGWLVYEVYEVR
ncbi:MAG: DUF3237 family protein, partial [Caulobacteraceae bacterium]|nr:DUF3237 family protein [Caulobacteraceae bacterium]